MTYTKTIFEFNNLSEQAKEQAIKIVRAWDCLSSYGNEEIVELTITNNYLFDKNGLRLSGSIIDRQYAVWLEKEKQRIEQERLEKEQEDKKLAAEK